MRSTILVFAFICSTLMHASGVLGQASLDTASLAEFGGPDGSVVILAASGTAQELQETEVGDSGEENFSLDEDGFYAVADGDISSASSFFQESNPGKGIGSDFFGLNDSYDEGLIISNGKVAMKIGGFVKLDAIYDFNAIDSTDSFDTATIVIGALPRKNARLHARQTRFNADTRWESPRGPARIFVEGDFFFNQRESSELGENRFRLRHAYIQHGKWLAGQTWTTLADVAASPATLDFEGQVASVTTRRAQIRWTQRKLFGTKLALALAVEDPFTIIEVPELVVGEPRTQTPDGVFRLRYEGDLVQTQVAGVLREIGYQKKGMPVIEDDAWGVNFTQVSKLTTRNKFYSEILWGNGIGSFRGIPDFAPTVGGGGTTLGSLGWMLGTTHEWNEKFSSNFVYAENGITNEHGLMGDELKRVTYMAANLIYTPTERAAIGIEYLYGTRVNFDGQKGQANRVQFACTYYLP